MWPFDNTNQQIYEQYAQAYESGNYSQFDPHQTLNHLQHFMRSAPNDVQQRIYQQYFEQMPYEERTVLVERVPPEYEMDAGNPWSMSQSFLRLGQEQPQLFQRIFGHPAMLGGTFALTGLVARHMLTNYRSGAYGDQDERLRRELGQERREEREIRRELRREERRVEDLEDEEAHRRRRRDY